MKRIVNVVIVAALAGEALILGQGSDAGKILADVRAALGGSAVASAKSLAATGHMTRINDGVLAIRLISRWRSSCPTNS